MDDESDFTAESFRLAGGGSSYALVHIPTGLRVDDPWPSDKPVAERWAALRRKMAELLHSQQQ